MRIDALSIHPIRVPRKQVFEIARGKSTHVEQVVVSVLGEGLDGWGAGSANSVTGEKLPDMYASIQKGFDAISDEDLDAYGFDRALCDHMKGHPAAMCAVSLAIWDLAGKAAGTSIADLHGLKQNDILSDMSIGLCSLEETIERAEDAVSKGFKALKLKVGSDDQASDAKRVNAVRKRFPELRLWADGNRGYTVKELKHFLKGTRDAKLDFIEEPCEGIDEVQNLRKGFKLMADESAIDSMAIEAICKRKSADMVNIKLMKCGTVSEALLSAEILENHDVPGMIGCMGETSLSIAGAVQVALASKSIVISDLDSAFMLKDDIGEGLRFDDGCYRYTRRPGLGVQVDLKKVLQYEVEL